MKISKIFLYVQLLLIQLNKPNKTLTLQPIFKYQKLIVV